MPVQSVYAEAQGPGNDDEMDLDFEDAVQSEAEAQGPGNDEEMNIDFEDLVEPEFEEIKGDAAVVGSEDVQPDQVDAPFKGEEDLGVSGASPWHGIHALRLVLSCSVSSVRRKLLAVIGSVV